MKHRGEFTNGRIAYPVHNPPHDPNELCAGFIFGISSRLALAGWGDDEELEARTN
jgi:hypothetical protein